MKILKSINKFFFRIDGIISLALSVLAFLGLLQCALGVQAGIQALYIPCLALIAMCIFRFASFMDWVMLVSRKTRVKMVELKSKQLFDVWEVPYEE